MKEQNEEQAIEGMAKEICHAPTCEIKKNVGRCYKYCKAYIYAFRAINKGYRKQSGWISAEKPPEIYRDEYDELIPFLVCCKGTVYPFRAVYDGTNWGDGIGKLKVAYWMPLPEPPKMKGGA